MSEKQLEKALSKVDQFKIVSLCRNLIRIPSYPGQEAEKASYVARGMERLGLEVFEVLAERDRPNVVGVLRGSGGHDKRSLMLCAHLDTHWPLEGQEEMAHTAKIEDGKIFGVGAGDSMTPISAIFGAIDAIKKSDISLEGDIIFSTTVDEMTYGLGGRVLIENGMKADMCIIGEPTDFNIGVVHPGRAEAEIEVRGLVSTESGHYAVRAGMPVINAVVSMNKVINALLRMEKEDPFFNQKHPLLPGRGAAFYIGPIIGGSTGYGSPVRKPGFGKDEFGVAKITPAWCTLKVGARHWPGQTSKEFFDVLAKWIDKAREEDKTIDYKINPYMDDPPVEIAEKEEVVSVLGRSIEHVLGKKPSLVGNVYWTEAALYYRQGIPAAWFGPPPLRFGRPDEHVTIEELTNTCKIFTAAILFACGGKNQDLNNMNMKLREH